MKHVCFSLALLVAQMAFAVEGAPEAPPGQATATARVGVVIRQAVGHSPTGELAVPLSAQVQLSVREHLLIVE